MAAVTRGATSPSRETLLGRSTKGLLSMTLVLVACGKADSGQCEGACGTSSGNSESEPIDDAQQETGDGTSTETDTDEPDNDLGSTDEDPFDDCVEPDPAFEYNGAGFESETWEALFDLGDVLTLEEGACSVHPDGPYPQQAGDGLVFDLTCTRVADESVHEGALLVGSQAQLGALDSIAGTEVEIHFEYVQWVGTEAADGLLRVSTTDGDLLALSVVRTIVADGIGDDGFPEYALSEVALPVSEAQDPNEWLPGIATLSLRDDLCPVEAAVVTEFQRRLAFEIDAAETAVVFDGNRAEIDVGGRTFDLFANAARVEWNDEDWEHQLNSYDLYLRAR